MERGEHDTKEHEGERFLSLLGLGHLADTQIVVAGGNTIKVRDFLEVCGVHARPVLLGLEAMNPEDPRYQPTVDALRGLISQYVGIKPES